MILTAVAKYLVGCRHFFHRNAAVHAADRHGRDLHAVRFRIQMGKVQLIRQEAVRRDGRNHFYKLCRRGVGRNFQRALNRNIAVKLFIPVVRAGFSAGKIIVNRLVGQNRRVIEHAHIDRRAVGCDRFNGRTGLPLAVRCIAEQTVARLFAAPAHGGKHTTVVVHHKIAQLDFLIRRHVVAGNNLFRRILRLLIHGAVNLQAAVVHHVNGLILRDSLRRLHVLNNILEHGVDIPVPHRGIVDHILVLIAHKHHVVRFLHGAVVFVLADHLLVEHFTQHKLLAGLIVFGKIERIVLIWILRDGRDGSTLGQRSLADVLAEIQIRRRLHALTPAAVVDNVQVCLQNLFLGIAGIQIDGAENLLHLTGQAHLALTGDILDQLLRNGRAAVAAALGNQCGHGAGCTNPVYSVMFHKPLIFNCDHRVFHILGDFVVVHPNAVLRAVKPLIFHRLARIVVHINKAGIIELQIIQIHFNGFIPKAQDKRSHKNQHNHSGNRQNRYDAVQPFQSNPCGDRCACGAAGFRRTDIFIQIGFPHRRSPPFCCFSAVSGIFVPIGWHIIPVILQRYE